MTTLQEKHCSKCKKIKPILEFQKDKRILSGYNSACKECKNKYARANRKCRKEYQRDYQIKNEKEVKRKRREYNLKNKEKINEHNRKKYRENIEKEKARKKKYWILNKERMSKKAREYRSLPSSKEKERARGINRNSKKKEIGIKDISAKTIRELMLKSSKECYWCNEPLNIEKKRSYHVDHYIPLSKGGTNDIGNLVLSCPFCNMSKGARDPLEFANSKGRLL